MRAFLFACLIASTAFAEEVVGFFAYANGDDRTSSSCTDCLLGKMYQYGLGIAKDMPKAFLCYKKAALQKEVLAQLELGFLYDTGQDVKLDYQQAFFGFKKSAEKGYARAEVNLGSVAISPAPTCYGLSVASRGSKSLANFFTVWMRFYDAALHTFPFKSGFLNKCFAYPHPFAFV
jgi:TPR repeat protein